MRHSRLTVPTCCQVLDAMGSLRLSPEQQQLLSKLQLQGAGANVDVSFGMGEPIVDARLLAGAHIICAQDASELKGAQLSKLGSLDDSRRAAHGEVRALECILLHSMLFLRRAHVG